jgi:hypothetical protein
LRDRRIGGSEGGIPAALLESTGVCSVIDLQVAAGAFLNDPTAATFGRFGARR